MYEKIISVLLCSVMLLSTVQISFAAEDNGFLHPGVLNTQVDLDRIKTAVANQEQPIYDGWQKLLSSGYSAPSRKSVQQKLLSVAVQDKTLPSSIRTRQKLTGTHSAIISKVTKHAERWHAIF